MYSLLILDVKQRIARHFLREQYKMPGASFLEGRILISGKPMHLAVNIVEGELWKAGGFFLVTVQLSYIWWP